MIHSEGREVFVPWQSHSSGDRKRAAVMGSSNLTSRFLSLFDVRFFENFKGNSTITEAKGRTNVKNSQPQLQLYRIFVPDIQLARQTHYAFTFSVSQTITTTSQLIRQHMLIADIPHFIHCHLCEPSGSMGTCLFQRKKQIV